MFCLRLPPNTVAKNVNSCSYFKLLVITCVYLLSFVDLDFCPSYIWLCRRAKTLESSSQMQTIISFAILDRKINKFHVQQ